MKQNGLIIIGGNSKLISKFLNDDLFHVYKKIIVISHRAYKGEKNYEIIDNINPKFINKALVKIISDKNFSFDLIISNTPTGNADFQDENTLEWSLLASKIMDNNDINRLFRKIIFTGSCLPLLPLYHDSYYKNIKNNEMIKFMRLCLNYDKKFTYIILPPLKFKNIKKLSFIIDDYEKWAVILKEELGFC